MEKMKYNLDIQYFAVPEFVPDNVLLMEAKNGVIPAEQGELVLKEFMANSAVMQLAKQETMTKPIKKFTYLAEGPGAYWVDEANKIETSKATWLTAEMEAKKLGVIIPVSKEFLKWTVPNFFNEVRPAIAEAFYKKFDQAALFGNETPYAANASIWENITNAGNVVVQGTTDNLYTDLNAVLATIEDGDNDPDGLVTTRKLKKDLRGAVDTNMTPIFNEVGQGAANQVLGLPIGYTTGTSWDYTKAVAIAGDWDYARYGILQGIEYTISEDATLSTVVDELGEPINLFERDMFALRATMHIAFITLKEDAFGALTPDVDGE